jgi:hypothetical protein
MSIETMTKLATTVLSANTASVTFSNIPQNYTDLRISVSGRTTGGVGDSSELGTISFSFGSTSYTYSDRFIGGSGTAAYSSANSTAATSTPIYWVNGSGSTASTFASVNIDIPNYALNNVKNISYEAAPEYNNSTLRMMLGTISTTKTDPVTQIVLTAGQTAFAINSTFTLYGVKAARTSVGNSIKAVGGNISFDGTYVSHTFNTSGTFTPSDSLRVDYLVVAGGGGGGAYYGAGGGAGGLRSTVTASGGSPGTVESALSLTAGTAYTVTVGAGGTGGIQGGTKPTQGGDSAFSTITSTGGGLAGGNHSSNRLPGNGGSGGGSRDNDAAGTGTASQGFAGGVGSSLAGGGGGGAGAVGTSIANNNAANGGAGVAVAISGSSVTYAGGGGNGGDASSSGGVGGGGGRGVAGTANTGGGGGGGTANGLAGGSGVVVIRYRAVV